MTIQSLEVLILIDEVLLPLSMQFDKSYYASNSKLRCIKIAEKNMHFFLIKTSSEEKHATSLLQHEYLLN